MVSGSVWFMHRCNTFLDDFKSCRYSSGSWLACRGIGRQILSRSFLFVIEQNNSSPTKQTSLLKLSIYHQFWSWYQYRDSNLFPTTKHALLFPSQKSWFTQHTFSLLQLFGVISAISPSIILKPLTRPFPSPRDWIQINHNKHPPTTTVFGFCTQQILVIAQKK